MLILRRRLLLGASATGFTLVLTGRQAPALMFEGVPVGEAPGDEGYKHELYHDEYQKLFGDLGVRLRPRRVPRHRVAKDPAGQLSRL